MATKKRKPVVIRGDGVVGYIFASPPAPADAERLDRVLDGLTDPVTGRIRMRFA